MCPQPAAFFFSREAGPPGIGQKGPDLDRMLGTSFVLPQTWPPRFMLARLFFWRGGMLVGDFLFLPQDRAFSRTVSSNPGNHPRLPPCRRPLPELLAPACSPEFAPIGNDPLDFVACLTCPALPFLAQKTLRESLTPFGCLPELGPPEVGPWASLAEPDPGETPNPNQALPSPTRSIQPSVNP